MTEDELLAANLEALGIGNARVGQLQGSRDRVYEAYVECIRNKGRVVTAVDVADHTGICSARVSLVARELFKEGRMRKLTDQTTGKTVYIPVVERAAPAKKKARG